MFSFFKKSSKKELDETVPIPPDFSFLSCDMHSHLIPGIDDGSPSLEESEQLILGLQAAGYRKLITTPHVIGEFYPNTKERLLEGHHYLQQYLKERGVQVEIGISAEYYLDNYFLLEVLPHGLLTFGDNYVLVEVSMAGWPRNIDELLFNVQSLGYKPILAHPERYVFEEQVDTFLRLKEKGILMQMNLLSLTGYYNKIVKTNAEHYLKSGLYDFCGTDTHHARHVAKIGQVPGSFPAVMQQLSLYNGFMNSTL